MAECVAYFASHGCSLPRGHDGDHECRCTEDDDGGESYVFSWPRGAPNAFGEDA